MPGMHGNNVKKAAEQDTSKIKAVDNKQSTTTDCGMKNMHESSSAKSVQVTNKIDATPNLGKNLDVRA
jgi:hypothetical protein